MEEIRTILISALTEQLAEMGITGESVIGETRLSADLGFSSVDALQLMTVIDIRLGTKLPFETLIISDGQYVKDLTVDSLAKFAFSHFDSAPPPLAPMWVERSEKR